MCSLRSDNGTNFIGAERELREDLAAIDHGKIHCALLQKASIGLSTPPLHRIMAAYGSGLIRMVRKVLCSVLHQQSLDDEGLHTILCEVEAILNDRPITQSFRRGQRLGSSYSQSHPFA